MSIIKVAEVAGVSKSTVSRVINQAPGVADAVRDRVLSAMKEIGYQPSARRPGPKPASRKGIRTGNVMLLVLGFDAHQVYRMPMLPSLLHGIEIGLRGSGLNLVMASYQPDGPLPAGLGLDQVDGVLIVGRSELDCPALRDKMESVPAVGLLRGRETFDGVVDQVLYNNREIGPMMARFLLEQGHQRLAFVNAQSSHPAFSTRTEGFARTAREAGVRVLELEADDDGIAQMLTMRNFAAQITKKANGITGIGVCSDTFLPALAQALAEAGSPCGDGVALIGCDNEEQFLRQVCPRPATIDIHPQLVGQHAVRQLLWRIGHMDEASRLTLIVEPELVVHPL